MKKRGEDATSGISRLSSAELKKYEGKFVGIVDGKVAFADSNADKVIKWVIESPKADKVFSAIPKSSVSLVR